MNYASINFGRNIKKVHNFVQWLLELFCTMQNGVVCKHEYTATLP